MKLIKRVILAQVILSILFTMSSIGNLPGRNVQAAGSTYYVSVTGDDTKGDGSKSKPWKTLVNACKKVVAGKGYTIQMGEGTFVQSEICNVPLGVNILGAGPKKTFLQTSPVYKNSYFFRLYSQIKYKDGIKVISPGNQTLSGFKMDGSKRKISGGINIFGRDNVTVTNVALKDFGYTGIVADRSDRFKVSQSTFTNCSGGNDSYCTGNVMVGDTEGSEISNVTIREDTGYGIKAMSSKSPDNIKGLKIHDCDIQVAETGKWAGGKAPSFTIELWDCLLENCEIYNNILNNNVSLVGYSKKDGTQTIKLDHNNIKPLGYAVELDYSDMEVCNNYIDGGAWPFACWNTGSHHNNVTIHHNVISNYSNELIRYVEGCDNLKILNNTIYIKESFWPVIKFYGGSGDNIQVKNNIIYNLDKPTGAELIAKDYDSIKMTGIVVENNFLFNVTPGRLDVIYKNNFTGDPKLNFKGTVPGTFFRPQKGSPVIDAGVDLGYPYSGKAPDIGAYEDGNTTDVIGKYTK